MIRIFDFLLLSLLVIPYEEKMRLLTVSELFVPQIEEIFYNTHILNGRPQIPYWSYDMMYIYMILLSKECNQIVHTMTPTASNIFGKSASGGYNKKEIMVFYAKGVNAILRYMEV